MGVPHRVRFLACSARFADSLGGYDNVMSRRTLAVVALASTAAVALVGCSGGVTTTVEPEKASEPVADRPLSASEAAAFWEQLDADGTLDQTCDLGRDAFTTLMIDEVGADPSEVAEYAAWGALAHCPAWELGE